MTEGTFEIIDTQLPPAMRSLLSVLCPVCGGSKAVGRTFCEACCLAVGPSVRAMLCVSADAYPAAFERAMGMMGKEAKV